MREDLKILEKIDQYIVGQMSGVELNVFENEIQNNPTLKKQVENQQLIIQAAKRKVLSNQINTVATGGGGNFKFNWTLGIGLTFLLIAIVIYTQLDLEKYNQGEDVELSVPSDDVIGETNDASHSKIEEVTMIDTTSEIFVELTPKTKSRVQSPFKISVEDTTLQSDFEFHDFNGLKCWVKPTIQLFEIDANTTETVEGENGTLIIIPENSFLDEDGQEVKGKIDFELVEAYELSDMLLYNLTTMSDGNLLETGGMFYTNATQNGKQLTVDPSKPMMIQVPCVEEKEGMMVFESEIDTSGNINWKNPKPLEQFLTKVDMDLLNYLPEGFEDEVYANMPILGLEKASPQVANKLYYSLKISDRIPKLSDKEYRKMSGIQKENYLYQIGKKGVVESEGFWMIPREFDCGIDPLSIRTILENTDYSNSYVATKEFEERLVELHKLENGQEMLDVYLDNLDENLWYSDSIVAGCIPASENSISGNKISLALANGVGGNNNIFEDFYAQRKTKVRDADLYAEALTKYYNVKKQEYNDEMERLRQKNDIQLTKEIIRIKELSQSKNKVNIQANAITNVNVSRENNYTVSWASFGWANIDAYLHMVNKSKNPKQVEVTASNGKGKIRMYQWLGAISTLTPIIVNQFSGLVKFPKAGSEGSLKMKNTYTIAISNDGDKWFFGAKRYNPYQTNGVDVDLTEATLTQIKVKLRQFNGTTPLMKHLSEDIKRLEQLKKAKEEQLKIQQVKLEKQQKEDAFINRLKGLCFLCYEDVTVKTEANEIIDVKSKNK